MKTALLPLVGVCSFPAALAPPSSVLHGFTSYSYSASSQLQLLLIAESVRLYRRRLSLSLSLFSNSFFRSSQDADYSLHPANQSNSKHLNWLSEVQGNKGVIEGYRFCELCWPNWQDSVCSSHVFSLASVPYEMRDAERTTFGSDSFFSNYKSRD
ncbi:hypothetical protein K1719_016164 [Acacia pycnantha]|nr:hypothetical protein K1719_016164 [Acacia pycnantha]